MKPDIHPKYRPVVFRDSANGATFLISSTVEAEETVVWEDGKTYPLVTVEISSASHPFYTGQQRLVDSQGRVDKFRKRFGADVAGQTVRKSRRKPLPETP